MSGEAGTTERVENGAEEPVRVLVAEDDAVVARDLKETLESLGYGVTSTVHSGGGAVTAAGEERPDVALLDIRMPGAMDGLEAGQALADRGIPVIYVTAYADNGTLKMARETLPYGYVTKPFDARELKTAIEVALARYRADRRYRMVFERQVAGMFRARTDGEILEVNRAFAELLGYDSPADLEGKSAAELYPGPEERSEVRFRLRETGAAQNVEHRMRRRDGSFIWVLENSVVVRDPELGEDVFFGSVVNITDRKHLEEELESLAFYDSLTGLANRRLFRERAEQTLALSSRRGEGAGLVYLDLAGFKRVNDAHGHAGGDQALIAVARRLEEVARESDTVARAGGDEFAVLLADVEEAEGAEIAARRLVGAVSEPVALDDATVQVAALAGVALYPDHGEDFESLFSAADRALHRLKTFGTGTVQVCDAEAGPAGETSRHDADDLRRAVQEGELVLHYQPVRRTEGGELVGAEALVRWSHPELGLLEASHFVSQLDRAGLLRSVDEWVLEEAVRQAAAWRGPGTAEWISVNLSAATLRSPDLPDHVERLLEEAGVEGRRLIVEVAESSPLRNPDAVARSLSRLREMGIRIALDNFGSGQAGIEGLRRLPVDYIKMHGLFLREVEGEGPSGLAAGIVRLGEAAGMEVVAKEVEEEGEYGRARDARAGLAQGYFLGGPVPPEEVV